MLPFAARRRGAQPDQCKPPSPPPTAAATFSEFLYKPKEEGGEAVVRAQPLDGAPPPTKRARTAGRRPAPSPWVAATCAALPPATLPPKRRPRAPKVDSEPPSFVAPLLEGVAAPEVLRLLPPAFIASDGLWRERYASACIDCFTSRSACTHHPEVPLRLLLVGHNPSTHAWTSGYPYSNPSNRFFLLLRSAGLFPPTWRAADCDAAPALLSLGITDLGCEPGSDAKEFGRAKMLAWRGELYARLRAHLDRASAWTGAPPAACAPRLVGFTGKRQWASLFEPPLAGGFDHGVQRVRPPGWPLDEATEVWVLPSSSGRAAMTVEARMGPYLALGRRVAELGGGCMQS